MGQNYSALPDRNVGGAGIDIAELSDISYEKSLGSSRFLKTIKARHVDGGLVVVKIFLKPSPTFPLEAYRTKLKREQEALADIPNALSHQRIIETERAGYLVRQYLYSSLYDRISTRPFLEEIEKRWIAFQLLCGLRDCHARGIHHGDIKAENILVTSWNWIYLSDFAEFKPTHLPEDNPADFSYFFDTSGRRICYVAPERFLSAGERSGEASVTDEMDIFSLGCVIAELFLEGTPLFTLSQLFKYRKGEYDPAQAYLGKIEDPEIRNLVQHMINVDPSKRYSAEQYLNLWRRKAFPDYFYSFLHQYIGFITDPNPGRGSVIPEGQEVRSQADDRINRIYHDFDKISFFLGFESSQETAIQEKRAASKNGIIPVRLDIPNYQRQSSAVRRRSVSSDDGTLIFLSLIASAIRNTSRAAARVRACDIFLAFAERITDEAKLDRCLPYLVSLLNDDAIIVRVAAVRTVTQLMELVEVVSPVNAHVFPDYILPKLQNFATHNNSLVRATYASCLASLADSASRFLDMAQALRADGSLPTADPEAEDGSAAGSSFQALFDLSRSDLVVYFQEHSKSLLTDSDSGVRRSFLRSVSRLCVFFGSSKANDVVLSHLNTYLNDKDWMLRSAFFETITGVATYVGVTALEEYIMPLMVQSLTDPEEFVVEKVLRSLANMAELGLFQKSKIWELIDVVGRFMMHPNLWIRQGAVAFIAAGSKWLSPADVHCIVNPLVRPFLRAEVVSISALSILQNLQKPVSRHVFDMAVTWATQSKKGLFWQGAQEQRTFSFGATGDLLPRIPAQDSQPNGFIKAQKNEEDANWIDKLRNLGMSTDDEWKVIALREYIWRMALSKPRLISEENPPLSKSTISLQDLGITPHTVFFDENESFFHLAVPQTDTPSGSARPTTIADALLDASRTIDNPSRKAPSRLHPKRSTGVDITDIMRSRLNADVGANRPDPGSLATPAMATIERDSNQGPGLAMPWAAPPVTISGGSESSTAASEVENGNPLRRKPSTLSLLARGAEASKAAPETSTVSATAFGKVEHPFAKGGDIGLPKAVEVVTSQEEFNFRAAHSYEGNDPHILKLLDSMYLQNYPSDILEFGPTIVPVQRRQPIKKSSGRLGTGMWKPEGVMVAQYGEHSGAINRIIVAPDHNFFLTASDDGTVKVWDSSRLEKNVTFKARQTYKHGSGIQVKALCFVENTRCFVSAGTDGSVHVVKVDFQLTATAVKYGRLRLMRNWQLPEKEYAVWMEHFKAENNSVLLIATNMSNIHALDLRVMRILYTLKNPVFHGTPVSFCVNRQHNWLVLGTSHGVLDMWDLRFQLRLKAWGLPGSMPVHRIAIHPSKGRGKWIVVAGGIGHGEVSVWDCEKTQCREVYRAGGGKDIGKGHEPWNVDDESSEQMLSRFATAPNHPESGGSGNPDRGVRALAVGLDISEENHEPRALPGFIISAGADRKIRFWNCLKVESSMVVCGLDTDETKPTFTSSHPTPTLTLNTERIPESLAEARAAAGAKAPGASSSVPTSSSKRAKASGKTPRSTVISMQQQQLMKAHLDSILDVAFLEIPYGMIISADRSGVIFIYQ